MITPDDIVRLEEDVRDYEAILADDEKNVEVAKKLVERSKLNLAEAIIALHRARKENESK